jgi:hypothetical protein
MKPRERILKALSCGIPDRVPVIPKIWVDLASRLTDTDLVDVIEDPFLALRVIVDAGFMCGVDGVRQFHFPKRAVEMENGKVFEVDDKGRRIGEIDMLGGLITNLYDPKDFNIEDPYRIAHNHFWTSDSSIVVNMHDAKRICVPNKMFSEEIGCGERQRKVMKSTEGKIALIGDCHSATLAFYVELRGMNPALIDLVENPKLVHRVMEKGVAIAIEKGKFNMDMGMKILRLNDSVANMSVISPEHWRIFIYPHMKEVCDELHRYDPNTKIYCHICGNILPIVEDLIKTGIDCIGPLDPLGGFSPKDVRERAGDSISLMGGVNTLSFINCRPEKIIDEAKKCIIEAGERGGYILGSGCVIPRDGKKENIRALRAACERYGVYRRHRLAEEQELIL